MRGAAQEGCSGVMPAVRSPRGGLLSSAYIAGSYMDPEAFTLPHVFFPRPIS